MAGQLWLQVSLVISLGQIEQGDRRCSSSLMAAALPVNCGSKAPLQMVSSGHGADRRQCSWWDRSAWGRVGEGCSSLLEDKGDTNAGCSALGTVAGGRAINRGLREGYKWEGYESR